MTCRAVKRAFIVLLSLLPALQAFPQFVYQPLSARSSALGGCFVGDGPERYVSMGYRAAFGMAGCATASLDASFLLGERGRLTLGYSHFGDVDYAEHQALLGCSLRVGRQVALGVAAGYYVQAVGDGHYAARRWLAPAVTACVGVSPKVRFTAMAGTRPWDKSRPWRMHAGLSYRAVNRLLTLVEVEGEERWRLRMGVEYCYRQHFFFRTGLATAPLVITAGVGVYYGRYLVDLSVESHPVLGLTPHLSLSVCF